MHRKTHAASYVIVQIVNRGKSVLHSNVGVRQRNNGRVPVFINFFFFGEAKIYVGKREQKRYTATEPMLTEGQKELMTSCRKLLKVLVECRLTRRAHRHIHR